MKTLAYREFCDSTESVVRSLKHLVTSYGLDPDDFRTDILHLALFKTTVESKLSKKESEKE